MDRIVRSYGYLWYYLFPSISVIYGSVCRKYRRNYDRALNFYTLSRFLLVVYYAYSYFDENYLMRYRKTLRTECCRIYFRSCVCRFYDMSMKIFQSREDDIWEGVLELNSIQLFKRLDAIKSFFFFWHSLWYLVQYVCRFILTIPWDSD